MTAIQEPGRLEKRIVGSIVRTVFFRGRRGGPWPAPAGMPSNAVLFRGNSGARLAGLHVQAASPRGIVVLAHPDRRYGKAWFAREGWLEWLTSNGYDALSFDFPMYGESSGGSTFLHDDVRAAVATATELRPGLPVHLVGLSLGAFACANASPFLGGVQAMVLESPYPSFESWYEHGARRRVLPAVNRALGRMLPRTYGRIDAGANIRLAAPERILVAASSGDDVTPAILSRRVRDAAPAAKTAYLELDGIPHLGLFRDERYRAEVLATLDGRSSRRP